MCVCLCAYLRFREALSASFLVFPDIKAMCQMTKLKTISSLMSPRFYIYLSNFIISPSQTSRISSFLSFLSAGCRPVDAVLTDQSILRDTGATLIFHVSWVSCSRARVCGVQRKKNTTLSAGFFQKNK